jgi:hypothetical protein
VHNVPFAEFAPEGFGIGASACAAVSACASVETAVCVSSDESSCVGDLRQAVAVAIMTVKITRVFIVWLDGSKRPRCWMLQDFTLSAPLRPAKASWNKAGLSHPLKFSSKSV